MMMARRNNLRRNQSGVGTVEFALAAPIVIMLIVGTLTLGNYMFAKNSVSAAIDSVGREAGVFPTPTDAELRTIFNDAILKEEASTNVTLNIAHGRSSNGTAYVDLTSTYEVDVDLVFVSLGQIPVRAERRVYINE